MVKLPDMVDIWYTLRFCCLAHGCDLEDLGGSLSVWGTEAA